MKYSITYDDPHCHFINIEAVFEAGGREAMELRLADWRPGRYHLMGYARNIRSFAVSDAKGNALRFRKTAKNIWEIDTGGHTGPVVVRYDYFAAQMDAGATWLDEHQLYVNPVNCLLYDPERIEQPCVLQLEIPESYKIASQLAFQGNTATTGDFLQLADGPFIAAAEFRHFECRVGDTPFHIWVQGPGDFDWDRFQTDLGRFAALQSDVMGGFPFDDYHFLVQFLPYQHYHGVEHFNSTVIVLGPTDEIDSGALYTRFLGVCSHELFHVWNVCRIRPVELMPYDFSRPQYFETGFVAEGITTYYGDLFLLRGGVLTLSEYLTRINQYVKRHFENSGRFHRSLSESSIDLWLDGYAEETPGRRVSIYVKGALVAMLLDLELMVASEGSVRLDHLMQYLWQQFGIPGRGYSKRDLLQGLYEVSGTDFTPFFDRHIDGCVPLEHELDRALQRFGMKLSVVHTSDPIARWLGIKTRSEGAVGIVHQVAPLSPAYGKVCVKDHIVRVDASGYQQWSEKHAPIQNGNPVELEIERSGRRHTLKLKWSDVAFFTAFEIVQMDQTDEKDRKLLRVWSGLPNIKTNT